MDIEKVKSAQSQDEARDYAIQWQQEDTNLSWEEVMEWSNVFETLARKFDLVEEFRENGII